MRGEIVDQTGLPLPGVTIEVLDGTTMTAAITSEPDGTFAIPDAVPGTHVIAHLEGFESTKVLRPDVGRIVLLIACERLQARESLPLLPSVIRGPDGLMRLSA